MNDVVYLYGFVPAASPAPPAALRGLEERSVELLPLDDVAAVVSYLPAAEYDAAHVDARLQDLGWLAERGIAHERVVAWFVDHGEILPAGLLTLYSSAAVLADAAALRAAELASQLARLRGRREWDLKVSYQREQLERHAGAVSPEVRALDEEIASAAPGRRFLLDRKRAELLKRDLGSAARTAAARLFDRLQVHAEDTVGLPPPREAPDLPVVLAAALLVARDREADLRRDCAEESAGLEPLGFTVELTGPWAPYRFLEANHGPTR